MKKYRPHGAAQNNAWGCPQGEGSPLTHLCLLHRPGQGQRERYFNSCGHISKNEQKLIDQTKQLWSCSHFYIQHYKSRKKQPKVLIRKFLHILGMAWQKLFWGGGSWCQCHVVGLLCLLACLYACMWANQYESDFIVKLLS